MGPRCAMLVTLLAPVALAVAAGRAGSETPANRLGDLRAVGTVELRTSCRPEAQASFDRATALLHSFFYEEARRGFAEVEAKDPGCAMAHWGVAMTLWHPIWTPPTPEEKEAGRKAIERARAIGGRTDVERGLIGALSAYYADLTVGAAAVPRTPITRA